MTNSRASSKLELLDNHLATGTEATYTFTKTLDMKLKFREIQILVSGRSTAAFSLLMKLSGHTDYDVTQITMDVTTLSGSVSVADGTATLLAITLIDGAVSFHGRITIFLNDADDKMNSASYFASVHEGHQNYFHSDETTGTDITSIEIKTSTSTWIAGTEISIYGLRR